MFKERSRCWQGNFSKAYLMVSIADSEHLDPGFCHSIQEIDDVDQTLKFDRSIETSVGVQLDGLGQILGLARLPDEGDEDYREKLKFQIFINKSNGTPEEVIAVLKFLTKATKIRYHEYYPAAFQMDTDGVTFSVPPRAAGLSDSISEPRSSSIHPDSATLGFLFHLFSAATR